MWVTDNLIISKQTFCATSVNTSIGTCNSDNITVHNAFPQHMMVDEADVNEAMTGPQQRKRSADSPSGSPAAKRIRSGASSPAPPSRRPNSPGIPGGLQGGLLKKPIEQLIQNRQKTEGMLDENITISSNNH